MIVWTIYREGNGPQLAFKFLGEDLGANVPYTANAALESMAQSIVRNRVAKSSIEDITKNRNAIKDEIKKEMGEAVKGWGVYLETVEVTDVKILSKSLFRNLQTEYIETTNKTAVMTKRKIDAQIETERLQNSIVESKR